MTLNLKKKKKIHYITIIINANNNRFAVLCNKYFSACDWRFIWCQFVSHHRSWDLFTRDSGLSLSAESPTCLIEFS